MCNFKRIYRESQYALKLKEPSNKGSFLEKMVANNAFMIEEMNEKVNSK